MRKTIEERVEEMAEAGEISGQVRYYLLHGEHIQPENNECKDCKDFEPVEQGSNFCKWCMSCYPNRKDYEVSDKECFPELFREQGRCN